MGMSSANERQCYIVTSYFIGCAHSQSDLCKRTFMRVIIATLLGIDESKFVLLGKNMASLPLVS